MKSEPIRPRPGPVVLALRDVDAKRAGCGGGKAEKVARMIQAGLPVPDQRQVGLERGGRD